jgi:hypothetical protein
VKELGFQLLDKRDRILLREAQCEVLGFGVLWGSRVFGAACRASGYNFTSFNGESGISAL